VFDLSHNKIGTVNSNIRFAREAALKKLNVSSNKIRNLNFLNNDGSFGTPLLTYLNISDNFLTELDLRGSKNLVELDCTGNPLTSLSLTPNISPSPHLINCENKTVSPPFAFD
jgi:hypothetical protein